MMKTNAEYAIQALKMLSKWATYTKVEPEPEPEPVVYELTAQECEDQAVEAYLFTYDNR